MSVAVGCRYNDYVEAWGDRLNDWCAASMADTLQRYKGKD